MTERRRDLARIHCLKRDLKLSVSDYRALLWTLARVDSAKDLDATGRGKVILHLVDLARRSRVRPFPGKPRNAGAPDRAATIKKIEAMLAEERRPWSYATGIAKRMFKKQRLEFCTPDELHKVMLALEYDRRRREAVTDAAQ